MGTDVCERERDFHQAEPDEHADSTGRCGIVSSGIGHFFRRRCQFEEVVLRIAVVEFS
jgi:hypothetical protein